MMLKPRINVRTEMSEGDKQWVMEQLMHTIDELKGTLALSETAVESEQKNEGKPVPASQNKNGKRRKEPGSPYMTKEGEKKHMSLGFKTQTYTLIRKLAALQGMSLEHFIEKAVLEYARNTLNVTPEHFYGEEEKPENEMNDESDQSH